MIDLMERFEDDFKLFEEQYFKVKESRISEYRATVLAQFEAFFKLIHEHID